MPRYIDAELLESKYREGTDPQDPYSEITYLLSEDIESIPTADVQEVKHGRWIEKDSRYVHNFKCSVCNDVRFDIPTCMGKPLFNFCPNCGAKMDEEVKDNV